MKISGTIRKWTLGMAAVVWLAGAVPMVWNGGLKQAAAAGKQDGAKGRAASVAEEEMEVHFIDVGQADSILVKTSSAAMLIDAGNNEDGDLVVSYLKEQGVKKLDYVVGTHPHEDHIGGMDDVINSFEVETVILPSKTHTSKTFLDVLTAIKKNQLQITPACAGDEYSLGKDEFTILSPKKKEDYKDELNNWSVCLRLEHGSTSFVFTGDAESAVEKEMLDSGLELDGTVYKAAHHGSETSNTEEFLDAVNPEYVVISCGVDNQYGHPDLSVLEELADRDIEVFRTDEQGTVVAASDGKMVQWSTKPSTSMKEGKNPKAVETTVYITSSGEKYHSQGCRYLKKSSIPITLEEVQVGEYTPCSVCHPPN